MAEDNNLKIADPAVETNSSEIKSSSNAENEFYTVSKKWRKQLNNLQAQLVNPRDYTELERDARVLDKCMRELAAAQEALENTQSSTVEKMALYGKFEEMSRETNHVLVQVGQTVRELNQNENEDKQSVRSSRSSRSVARSKHSKSTRSSLASSSSSARLRRLELEEEIATLRVKMNLAHEKEGLDKASKSAMEEIQKRKLKLQMEEQQLMDEIETKRKRHKNISKDFSNPRQNHQHLLPRPTTTTSPHHQIIQFQRQRPKPKVSNKICLTHSILTPLPQFTSPLRPPVHVHQTPNPTMEYLPRTLNWSRSN